VRDDVVTTLEGFDALAPEWDGLVEAAARPSPFMLHGWLRALWPLCEEPRVIVARRQGRLAAALPLDVRRGVASFIGGMDAHLGDVLGEGSAELLAAAGRFDYADLFGMPAGSPLGAHLRLVERVEAPVLDLSPGWYEAKFSGKTRQTHRRKRRKLDEAEFVWTDDLEETFRIHALRWRGRPDGSGLAREDVRDAHRRGYAALPDRARILVLRVGGKTIAYNCALVVGRTLYSHRLAFDPAYGQFSPGLLCTLELFARAEAEGIERVELLGGGEEYKLQLADRLEPLYEGFGLARTARGRAVVAGRLAAVAARRRLKRFRRLHRLYVDGLAPARRAIDSAYSSR
jgi:CelD/BcsL family acetyltransferase involved in cellulose biosynthesis